VNVRPCQRYSPAQHFPSERCAFHTVRFSAGFGRNLSSQRIERLNEGSDTGSIKP
jgi:hypothetical protein